MKLRILGIRGVPAAHGGFETFAEYLALHLVARGWKVVVYCQEDGEGATWTDEWRGIERVHISVAQAGPAGTIVFDWKSTLHAANAGEPCLVLGYNTAVFVALLRARGVKTVINMDGIEWARAKWGRVAKLWFWLNDWAGCWLGGHLVADHPQIKQHLATRTKESRITMIPYGAEPVDAADLKPLEQWSLVPSEFLTVIARAEPENSLLEIVQGFSAQPRGVKLVVLGNYDKAHAYQRSVLDAASAEVVFTGAVYDKTIVQSLRYHSLAYVHGHQVGGTNPSLVEALGASNAIIAHDNRFNRWVAGDGAVYFSDAASFSSVLQDLLEAPASRAALSAASRARFDAEFTWPAVLDQYEELLLATTQAASPR